MFSHKRLIACVIICAATAVALACGPDFPWQLLDDRKETLAATPANSFAFEAERLVPRPTDSLRAIENGFLYSDPPAIAPWVDRTLMLDRTVNLSREQTGVVYLMRAAKSGNEAFDKGAELPAAIRLYTAGAVAFHKVDLSQAIARFQAILELPESERASRVTWATFMLGRSYARLGDVEKASQMFQQARALAVAGYPDPLGLAVESYGEEAKLYLARSRSYVPPNDELPPDRVNDYRREIATAIGLYAEQAARGSKSAVASLRIVAEHLLYPPTKLPIVVSDSLVQRLLVAYVLAVLNDTPARPYEEEFVEYGKKVSPDSLLSALTSAIEQNGLHQPVGADRLAALAYRVGRYDLATQLVAKASGPLAAWIKAKLATQKGDLGTAAAMYAEAVTAFPTVESKNILDERNARLLVGEGSVIALARGDYVEALAQLYPVASTYWGDVAYLAERVLTVNELKRFVDNKVSAQTVTKPGAASGDDGESTVEGPLWYAPDPPAQLRDLLARRLVREGRYQEALPYFHAEDDKRFTDPEVRAHVIAYAEALRTAKKDWWASNRAQGWLNAAVLARKYGMEMMGYETTPDFFANGGNYNFGYGQDSLHDSLVTSGESDRFATSIGEFHERFHYRSLALQHSNRAADLLPPRSQAFAAVLCRAAGWTNGTLEETAIYRRYVNEGPYVPWAKHFGRDCPEPDFTAAARVAWQQPMQDARRFARRHRWAIIVGGLGLVGIVVAWFAWRRPVGKGVV